jgi:hypothetical protein
MKLMLRVCLLGCALAVFLAMAVPLPVEGTWQGETHGLKSVTLEIHEADGRLGGKVIFYVVRDDGAGRYIAGQDERPLRSAMWDGKTFRFAVDPPDFQPDGPSVRLEMTLTGDHTAELKVLHENGEAPAAVSMRRNK